MFRRMALVLATVTATMTAMLGGGVAALAPASAAQSLTLQGTVAGSYRSVQSNPDTGRSYKVTGHGHTSLGRTTTKGSVQGPGNVSSGHCGGRLTLTTAHGTVVVSLQGTKQVRGFASCQSGFAFSWQTVSGTGSYQGQSGSGAGTLTLVKHSNASETPPPFYVTFDPQR